MKSRQFAFLVLVGWWAFILFGCDFKHRETPPSPRIIWHASQNPLPGDLTMDWAHGFGTPVYHWEDNHPFYRTPSEWKKIYAEYNSRFFGDELPEENVIILSTEEMKQSNLGETEASDGVFWIRISPLRHFGDRQARETLLHEMCHISLTRKKKQKDWDFSDHGPTFQREMIRIAKLWAFENAW